MVAAEIFRVEDSKWTPVNASQRYNYSARHHMHKQYTAYRVALQDTGNANERQLKEPMCYDTMRDVWGGHDGMDADAFFSSDAPANGNLFLDCGEDGAEGPSLTEQQGQPQEKEDGNQVRVRQVGRGDTRGSAREKRPKL
ncbi:hypothetical protein V7S43_014726 [Phytophthora oleae]|uniref:PiggyBac transposable element-derived protein domain-containing protein n=1 Tax=Phytophthora oleae TaxID=2107226 RepID=A0ABD3F059_9STRA